MSVKVEKCRWSDFCTACDDIESKQDDTCYSCSFYSLIDSDYGWCKYNPEPLLVAWCRDSCSHLKKGG